MGWLRLLAVGLLLVGCAERVLPLPDPPIVSVQDLALSDRIDLSVVGDLSAPLDLAPIPDFSSAPDLAGTPDGVAQGPVHGCAWRGDLVFCWGSNEFGQLGDGTRTSRTTAAAVVWSPPARLVQVAVDSSNPTVDGHTCALTAAGEVWCWGSNLAGELGDQAPFDQLTPIKVPNLPESAGVAVGAYQSCALARDGRVFCWGGYSGAGGASRPSEAGLSDAVEIACGHFHCCARHATGKLACWGDNAFGQIGTGTVYGTTGDPTPVINIDDAVQIVAGGWHTCARRAAGGSWCWGNGLDGELGDGTLTMAQPTPVKVQLSFNPVELSGSQPLCALSAGGTVSCWGPATIVNGALISSPTPMPVPGIADAAGLAGRCATRPSGVVSCWGLNDYGQIGDGTTTDRASPVEVQGLTW